MDEIVVLVKLFQHSFVRVLDLRVFFRDFHMGVIQLENLLLVVFRSCVGVKLLVLLLASNQ